jgi:hypothetical protein
MRHQTRHLHRTVLKAVESELTDLGWFGDPAPFGTTKITLIDYEPQSAGQTPAPNTVAVSVGDVGEAEDYELGGLRSKRYPIFVDIYPTKEAVGVAIADDVADLLTDSIIPLRDYTTDAAGVPTDARIEFETVMVETLASAATTLDKRTWRAVKAVAVCYF